MELVASEWFAGFLRIAETIIVAVDGRVHGGGASIIEWQGTGSHVGLPLRGGGAEAHELGRGRGRADTQVCPYRHRCVAAGGGVAEARAR